MPCPLRVSADGPRALSSGHATPPPGSPAPRARRVRQSRGPGQPRVRPGGAGRPYRPPHPVQRAPPDVQRPAREAARAARGAGRRGTGAARHRRPVRLAAGHRRRRRGAAQRPSPASACWCSTRPKRLAGVMLFEGVPVEGAPQIGTVSIGAQTCRSSASSSTRPASRIRAARSSRTRCSRERPADRRERRACGPGTARSAPG